MLNLGIQDEYRARFTYERVNLDFADPKPFSNIVQAEAKHVEAMAGLFRNRGLAVPVSDYTLTNVPAFSSVKAACEAGVLAEIRNWTMYAGFLETLQQAGTPPRDVQNVFSSLLEASRDQHLPAFEACAAR